MVATTGQIVPHKVLGEETAGQIWRGTTGRKSAIPGPPPEARSTLVLEKRNGMNFMSSGTLGCSLRRGLLIVAAVAIGSSCPAQIPRAEFEDLVRKLSDAATRQEARNALVELGEPVAGELVEALARWDPDRVQSTELLRVLGELGPAAARALPSLESVFPHLPMELWPSGLEAVGRIAPYSGGRLVTNRLLEVLMDLKGDQPDEKFQEMFLASMKADQKMRIPAGGGTQFLISKIETGWGPRLGSVMEELGRRGWAARSSLGPLKEYLQRGFQQMPVVVWEVNEVRVLFPFRDVGMMNAAEAMVKIDPDHADSLVAHAVLLKHADPLVRHRSLSAIAESGSAAAEAVPFLKANLFDASPEVIADSCSALGMIGPDAKGATIALEQLAEHEDLQIAGRAEAALQRIRR